MNEQWVPIIYKELTTHNCVESLIYENNNLKIRLFDYEDEISFKDTVLLYRSTNETYAFGRIDMMIKGKENTTVYAENTIFKVIDSEYIKELSLFSPALKQDPFIIHFTLIPTDCVIDVIAKQEPIVEYVYEEKEF